MSETGAPRRIRSRSTRCALRVVALVLVLSVPLGISQGQATHQSAVASLRGPVTATASPDVAPISSTALSAAYNWPEFHLAPDLQGYASNSPLSTTTASELGVTWDANLYAAALDSPVVAYDPILHQNLAYIGDEKGDVMAVNVGNGHIVWGTWLGSAIRSTPVISNGSVYVGTFTNPSVFRLNATTGALQCSLVVPQPLEGTPTIVTPPGGVSTLYIGGEDSSTASGPLTAMNAATCALEWQFTGYAQTAGTWDAAGYAVDANGVPLIIFGTADPDSGVYALNALTGAEVWRFQSYNPYPGTYDVGAGAALSAPGVNGFAGGVAYVPSKYGIFYALDLTTGAQIWSYNFSVGSGDEQGGRSTPALEGTNLVFGFSQGVIDLNAVTGAQIWRYTDPTRTEVLSSPAIAGANSTAIVACADLSGAVHVLSLATGAALTNYQTGGYITGSPAISSNNLLISGSDGFLYDFGVGGGNDAILPATSIASPVNGGTISALNGRVPVSGSATDVRGVARVAFAVRSGGTNGPWWDASSASWMAGPFTGTATLGTPGANATTWKTSFPVPSAGGTYTIYAYAISSGGQSDILGAQTEVAVLPSTAGPHISASPSFVAPGATLTVTGAGFAPSEKVSLQLLGSVLATATASATGSVTSTKLKVPSNATFGPASLLATGLTSNKSAALAVTIGNSWEEFGYSPARNGYEPNDPTLFNLIHPGEDIWVDLAWHFDAGAPIEASPAVVRGVAYVADTSGSLFALDVQNGGLLWTWTDPTGAALDGSPAVDPVDGLVFVGADDGSLYAISTSTGALAWSTALGGNVSAPAFASGELYVSTSTGIVASLSEITGAVAWSVALASDTSAPVAFDSASGVLVVGESDGDLVELSSTTGATLWTFVTGGPIVAAASISSGMVFVGSSDGSVYALSESSGAEDWAFATGHPVADTGSPSDALNGGLTLAIGSGNGELYVLQGSSGTVLFEDDYGSSIVGVATVKGDAIVETAAGVIGAARTYTDLDVWTYATTAGLCTSPVVIDGTIYVDAEDGNLYAFTSYGQAPD